MRSTYLKRWDSLAKIGMHFARHDAMSCRDVSFQSTLLQISKFSRHRHHPITCLFVDTKHRYSNTGTPCRNLCYIIHELLNCCSPTFLAFKIENDAEMLRKSVQSSNILSDEFRGTMVIIEDCERPI